MQRNHIKFARRTLYALKRKYGSPAEYHHVGKPVDNPETGVSTQPVDKIYKVRKAILLPSALAREMNIAGSYRRPTPGLPTIETDIETRFIIIDKEDLPTGLEIGEKDYLVLTTINNRIKGVSKRFNIQRIQELEDDIGVLITARHMRT